MGIRDSAGRLLRVGSAESSLEKLLLVALLAWRRTSDDGLVASGLTSASHSCVPPTDVLVLMVCPVESPVSPGRMEWSCLVMILTHGGHFLYMFARMSYKWRLLGGSEC